MSRRGPAASGSVSSRAAGRRRCRPRTGPEAYGSNPVSGSEMPDRRPPRRRSAQRPAERGRRSDPVRLAAYTVMRAVADGAYANLELPKVLRDKRIDGRDAAFATELVYGATRMRGLYDRVVEVAAKRPAGEIDGAVLDTLRLGVDR